MAKAETAIVDPADRERALSLTPVSRETSDRLDRFVDLLLKWQPVTNLIAPSTIPHLWTRHIADSLQIAAIAPDARSWIDLGSGGGFPGVVIACALADEPGAVVHLVESNAKKGCVPAGGQARDRRPHRSSCRTDRAIHGPIFRTGGDRHGAGAGAIASSAGAGKPASHPSRCARAVFEGAGRRAGIARGRQILDDGDSVDPEPHRSTWPHHRRASFTAQSALNFSLADSRAATDNV